MPRFPVVALAVALAGTTLVTQAPDARALAGSAARGTIPSNTRITDVAFFDPSHGYGIFTVTGASRCNDRVAATHNGGVTFSTPIPVVAWNCVAPPPVSSLAFDDHGDGFLYGPALYVTHDAGATWRKVPQAGEVLSVEALGYSIWMLEAVPHVAPGAAVRVLLFVSSDGGWNWADAPAPRLPASDGATQVRAWLVRTNEWTAYLGTQPVARDGRDTGTAPMWLTTDAGASWTSRQIPCSHVSGTVAMSAAPDGTLLAVCAGEPGVGMQAKETLRSVDQGLRWQLRSGCSLTRASSLHCTTGVPLNGYLGQVDAVSARTAYFVGGRSALTVTRDGGIHWAPIAGIGSTAGGTSKVIFFDARHGVVLGDGDQVNERSVLWRTNDGVHWQLVVPHYGT